MGSKRRRFCAYVGIGLIILWSIGTYYFAAFRVNKPGRMHSFEERTFQLKGRLDEVEAAIRKQAEENEKLLAYLKKQVDGQGGPIRIPPELFPKVLPPSYTDKQLSPTKFSSEAPAPKFKTLDSPVAVLVFACNRPQAIKNHLDKLLKLRPSKEMFPIVVSQDCSHAETTSAVQAYGDNVTLIQHPDQTAITLPPKQKKFVGYYKISRHYKWALNQTFLKFGYRTAIITEDDLDISLDFFEYFIATYPLLRLDPTLWCISAWNDNGKETKVAKNSSLLYRTDFFPGLGWMLTKETWMELMPSWPIAFWDDWMRKPEQRKDRACVRPELSRTSMSKHGKLGVSRGLFFEKHLKHIILNSEFVPFSEMDLSYLLKENYDQPFVQHVYSSPSITQPELHSGKLENGNPLPASVRLTYDNKNTYKTTAKAFGLMDDFRAGVPRTAYRGVVPFMYKTTRVFLAPMPDWNGYDPSWT